MTDKQRKKAVKVIVIIAGISLLLTTFLPFVAYLI